MVLSIRIFFNLVAVHNLFRPNGLRLIGNAVDYSPLKYRNDHRDLGSVHSTPFVCFFCYELSGIEFLNSGTESRSGFITQLHQLILYPTNLGVMGSLPIRSFKLFEIGCLVFVHCEIFLSSDPVLALCF